MGKVTDLDLTERFSWQHVLNMFLALCDDAADLSFDNRMLAGRRMLTLEMRLDAPAELTLPTVTEKNGALIETWANGTVVLGGTDEDVIKSLGGKANAQDSLLEALKVRIQKAKEAAA